MSHTPGPWRLDKWNGYLLSSENISIVKFDVSRTRLQDAQLIAAAPDLLEACEAMLAAFEYAGTRLVGAEYEAKEKIKAAIAKAKGQ